MARVLTRLHSGTAAAVRLSLSPHSPAHSPTYSLYQCLSQARTSSGSLGLALALPLSLSLCCFYFRLL
eukprot:1897928-Rhodomonas_salina.1